MKAKIRLDWSIKLDLKQGFEKLEKLVSKNSFKFFFQDFQETFGNIQSFNLKLHNCINVTKRLL